ncbi:MAG: hypothetical protein QNK05_06030, partial [Myxococcota bacterium]|nr:hypothetical protein [Myxococcota bacterium]
LLVTTRRQGTALPESLESGRPEGRTLRMQSLGTEESERIARAILGSEPDTQDLVQLAALRAGGNPLFVEELARSLREGSAGLRRAARLELAMAQASAEVPRNLRGVVAARIDALPAAEKRALEAAAVLGQPFEPGFLLELGISSVEAVSELRTRGLLRAGSGDKLDFRHGVVREVAYEQLVRPRRRELHLRAARALQRRDEGGSAAMAASIGGHLDAAEEAEEAVRYRITAGRHFARLHAPAEAAVQLRRGLELLGELPGERRSERAEAGVALAGCLNALDRSAEARAVLESVHAESVPENQRRLLARSLIQTGWVRFSEDGAVDGAIELIERGSAIAEAADPSGRILTLAHSFLSRIATLEGDGPGALMRTRLAMDHAEALGDDLALSAALYNRVGACTNVGDLKSAREAADRAAELAARRDDELLLAGAVATEVRVAYFEGDAERAIAQAESGRRLAERSGQVGLLYGCLVIEGYAQLLAGRAPEARDRFDELAALEQPWPTTEQHRARGRLECGDLDGAVEIASLCLERRPTRLVRARALAIRGLARGLRSAIDIDAAERDLAEAVSVCDALGVPPFRAEAQGFLADLWSARGDEKRAAYYRERAAAGYRQCGMIRFAAEFADPDGSLPEAVAASRS